MSEPVAWLAFATEGRDTRRKPHQNEQKAFWNMRNCTVLALRNLLSVLGWERTPNQVKNEFGEQLESLKEGFFKIKPQIEDLAIKFNEKEMNIGQVAEKLEKRLGCKVPVDHAKHLLLMNLIFPWRGD